jgi:DNA polymerase III subunit gamma/tau
MESFVVSARKYRPVTFDTVVGQQSITATLKNAIRNKQLAQAFLFTGPRGVGKTTCARILAKTINCEQISENIEACGVCVSCKSFEDSHSFNVHELDAASNNSVDGIRTLVDQVRIPPQVGKYKVYIIDEVHMLSQQAFNAFLKTLEEPPAYAKFILATTEKHKIIPTILSRCQIFDFARISISDIIYQLGLVAKQEGIGADPNALHIIAQKADGAMRDALSIFDQLVSFSGNSITYNQVIESLNVLDYDYYFRITDLILDSKTPDILILINEILLKGFDGADFITGFGEHLRSLLVSKVPATIKLIEVSDDVRERYLKQSALCPEDFLMNALDLISRADIQYKSSSNKRLMLELALLQMAGLVKKKPHKVATPIRQTLPDPTQKNDSTAEPIPSATEHGSTVAAEAPGLTVTATTSGAIVAAKSSTTDANPSEEKKKSDHPVHTEVTTQKSSDRKPTSGTIPGGLSLKIISNDIEPEEEEDTEEEEYTGELPAETISAERFSEAWKKLAEMQKSDSHGLFLAMTKYEPLLNKDGLIVVFLDNAIQEDIIRERKLELLSHLRKELNNYSLKIESRIKENDFKQKAWLPREKLENLMEKNPLIAKLKKELDLDFDY